MNWALRLSCFLGAIVFTLMLEPQQAAAQAKDAAVVSAADGSEVVARGSMARIVGVNLSIAGESAAANALDNPPIILAGVQVSVAGLPAQILSVSPDRVEFVVPAGVERGLRAVRVATESGAPVTVMAAVENVAPGIFQIQCLRRGRAVARSGGLAIEPFCATTAAAPAGDASNGQLTLRGTGFRNARSVEAWATLLSGERMPLRVVRWAPGEQAGVDDLVVEVPHELGNAGLVVISAAADKSTAAPVSLQLFEPASDTDVVPRHYIRTSAGNGVAGYAGDGGSALAAQLSSPSAVVMDRRRNLYVADAANRVVRVINPLGIIRTFAGSGREGSNGDGGPAVAAEFVHPEALAVDRLGNIYIADSGAHRVRMVDSRGIITTAAGNGTAGDLGDSGLATLAQLNTPMGLAADRFGNLYIADTGNHRVRMITGDGRITTLAGTGKAGFSGDGGPAVRAELHSPRSVAVDAAGTVYVADNENLRIRAIDPNGKIRTVAGTGQRADGQDADSPELTTFRGPISLAVDRLGRILVADGGARRVRLMALDCVIHRVAGTGAAGSAGDGGPSRDAQFNAPAGLASDPAGHVWVPDPSSNVVREMYFTQPDCSAPPAVIADPSSVVGGQSLMGYLRLACPAAQDTLYVLSASWSSVQLPSGVTVAAGQSVATFTVNTQPASETHTVSIVASGPGDPVSTTLLITAPNTAGAQVISITTAAPWVVGGRTLAGRVTIGAPAPNGGVEVFLSFGNAAASSSKSVMVPAGQLTADFVILTSSVAEPVLVAAAGKTSETSAATTFLVLPGELAIIQSFVIAPDTVTGGQGATGTITLAGPAPETGALVLLSSNDPSAGHPAFVLIPAGSTAASFPITTSPVQDTTTVTLAATSANSISASLTITPGGSNGGPGLGQIAGLTLNPSTVTGTGGSTGTIQLSSTAGPGGVIVYLTVDNPAAQVPASILIPEGQTSGNFPVVTSAVNATTNVTITATSANTVSANLTINPQGPGGPGQGQIASLTVNPSTVTGGSSSTGTVTLSSAAPAGGILVNLSSNNPAAQAPASLVIPQGQTSATFPIATSAVQQTTTVTITATSANSVSADLTLNPQEPGGPGQGQIASLTVNPSTVTGGSSSTGTVTLSSAAPAGGILVNLSSNNPAAQAPASLVIPQGQTSATFPISTSAVQQTTTVTITATSANSVSASLTINPQESPDATVSGLTVSPSSVHGGSGSTGTVTLSNAAPAGGRLVTLASNILSAQVPPSVLVPQGQTSATFPISTLPVAQNSAATITATAGNTSSAILAITAPCVQGLTLTLSITNILSGEGLLTGSVTLTGPAPSGGSTIQLISGGVQLGSVTVPSGQTSAPVQLSVTNAATLLGSVVQALLGTCSPISATVTLGAGQSGPAVLASLTLNPSSLTGGTGNPAGTVTLVSPAAAGGAIVALQSSHPGIVGAPAQIIVPAGQVSASFTMSSTAVGSDTAVTITATSANTLQAAFNCRSACVSSLNLTLSITNLLQGQGLLSGSISLTGPAPAGGSTVQLVWLNTNLGTVTVPEGQSTAPVSLNVVLANLMTMAGSTVTALLGNCPGFPVTVQLAM